jgi:hypothetical protein
VLHNEKETDLDETLATHTGQAQLHSDNVIKPSKRILNGSQADSESDIDILADHKAG